MRFDEQRVLSRPMELHWAGWRTTTYDLQRAGWSISAEQDIRCMTMGLALRSPHGDAYGISSRVPWEYMEDRQMGFGAIPLHAQLRFGRNIEMQHAGPMTTSYAAIDAIPQMVEYKRTKIEDFAHFAPAPLVRNNPIVVPEESVAELMDRILKLQQPDRTARIQAALRNPEGFDARHLPEQKFHAQIISFNQRAA